MHTYETVFAVPAILPEEEHQKCIRDIEELIQNSGGSVSLSEQMGEKKMAYKVRGHERAHYHLIKFSSPPEAIDGFKRHYRINNDRYIRTIIVREEE